MTKSKRGNLSENILEALLKWLGHVEKRSEEYK